MNVRIVCTSCLRSISDKKGKFTKFKKRNLSIICVCTCWSLIPPLETENQMLFSTQNLNALSPTYPNLKWKLADSMQYQDIGKI